MLINGETALDTISCNRLFLVPQSTITSKNTSKVFFSEFELNKSKYGYTETPEGGWDNEHWEDMGQHTDSPSYAYNTSWKCDMDYAIGWSRTAIQYDIRNFTTDKERYEAQVPSESISR